MDAYTAIQTLATVPALDIDGGNWPIFKSKFEDYIESVGLEDHFDAANRPAQTYEEVEAKPTKKTGESDDDFKKRSDVWTDGEAKWKEQAKAWKKDDAKARNALGKVIPSSTYMEISSLKDFQKMWKKVEERIEEITMHTRSNLKGRLNTMYCNERGNVITHLNEMESIYQQLASRNAMISDEDYVDTLIRSLPQSYSTLTSSILAINRKMKMAVTPTEIKDVVRKEYEARQTSQAAKNRKPDEVALNADARGRGRGRRRGRGGGGRGRGGNRQGGGERSERGDDEKEPPKFTCFNCGGKGHKSAACPSPRKPRGEKLDDRKGKETAAAAVDDEAWIAFIPEISTSAEDVETEIDVSTYSEEIPLPEPTETTPEKAFANPPADRRTNNALTAEILDSGCTRHMTPDRHRLANYREIPPKSICAANQESFSAIGMGDMTIHLPNGATTTQIKLRDVLYAPNMGSTLISVAKIDDAGYSATFASGKCVIRNPQDQIIAQVPKLQSLYRLETDLTFALSAESLTIDELHRRHGHVAHSTLRKMITDGLISGIKLKDAPETPCKPCLLAKAKKKPLPTSRSGNRATKFGELVYSDVWGPATTRTIGHAEYYVIFVDDAKRWITVDLMRKKSEVFDNYKAYEAWLKTQFDADLRTFQSDKGGEYTSHEFQQHTKSKGTIHRFSVHDVHGQNRVPERAHYTLLDGVRALLTASGLPAALWGEALKHMVWIRNRSPAKALDGMTPYEALYGQKPTLKGVREWGSLCWVTRKGSKIHARAEEGRWIGFDGSSKGHRIYWPTRRTISVEYDVNFTPAPDPPLLEGEIGEVLFDFDSEPEPDATSPVRSHQEPSKVTDQGDQEAVRTLNLDRRQPEAPPADSTEQIEQSIEESIPNPLPNEELAVKPPARRPWLQTYHDPSNILPSRLRDRTKPCEKSKDQEIQGESGQEERAMAAAISYHEGLEPQTLQEMYRRPDRLQWEEAMKVEIEKLKKWQTWKVVPKPEGANIIGSKWVFKLKKDANGNVTSHRARLVAQGFTQVHGIDFDDTFAPIARMTSIRTVLALAARYDWEIHQVDVKSAYLYGEIDKDKAVYMKPPPGDIRICSDTEVLQLLKAIYGLKQSGRTWYQVLRKILGDIGLIRSEHDHAVFLRREKGKITAILLIHVDDFTMTAATLTIIKDLKDGLRKHVEIHDQGEIHWMLGLEIKRNHELRTISLCQRSYIDSIISRYGFEDAKPLSIPMSPNSTLSRNDCPVTTSDIGKMAGRPYREAVGSLMYAAVGTRPDIAYAVSQVARFSDNPGQPHWEAVKRIFQYLKGTRDHWLVYGDQDHSISGYTDADGMSNDDRHTISSYAFLIDGGAVSWSSKRQSLVTLSTAEAEYVAATHAAKEAIWLREFISEIFEPQGPMTLHSDSQSAIALARNEQFHARTKHIDIRFHFIRYVIEAGKIIIDYCPTEDMVADTLTKALPSAKAKHFASALGLRKV